MSVESFEEFAAGYYQSFAEAILAFDKAPITDVLGVIDQVRNAGGTVWIAGNGGSAAIANHAVCDFSKGTYIEGQKPVRMISLAANSPIMTALGNDVSYDTVFSEQLKYCLTEKDALIVVSSSGNSPNVVNACDYANAQGVPTVAFVGFKGGRLKEIATHVVHVEVDNYGIVEDAHQSLIHVLTQYMTRRVKG